MMRYRIPCTWSCMMAIRRSPWFLIRESEFKRFLGVRHLFSETRIWPAKYDHQTRIKMEEYWNPRIQQENRNRKQFDMKSDKEKYYVLSMFPYPSGKLHMGHVRVYTLSDCMARYQRLKGKQVIHPMGWDAFGLPAENAAIERGEMPDKWTESNIESMRKQLEELQCSFDWDREVSTCDPSYYQWSQYIFLLMYEKGLVYQREGLVNWDPVDQTVLANEQIDDQGHSWRSGAKVEKRYLRQWFIKTTAYAESLLKGLGEVNPAYWKDIIDIQKNWIGKITGTRLEFVLKDCDKVLPDPLSVFTEKPHGLYGISHILLSPGHRYDQPQYTTKPNSNNKEKMLRLTAVHPVTGQEIPLVVSSTSDGFDVNDSHLGIPSFSKKDRLLAENLGLSFLEVSDGQKTMINSCELTGKSEKEAFKDVCQFAKEKGFGGHMVSSRLTDWLISRQRYWGTPIPMIHCPKCQIVPVPYEDLPVRLPKLDGLSRKGLSPLKQATNWMKVKCPKCGSDATRETDTMDTFVDSSWYFLRYVDPSNSRLPFDRDKADRLMPVDLYIGGKEHATLHLYFARFFNHFLCDTGYLSHREPFTNLLVQGMVMGQSYKVKDTGQYLRQDQVDFTDPNNPVEKLTGKELIVDWEKMSKSKYNGVDPQEIINEYGVSATRMTIVYNVAPKSDRKWSDQEVRGVLHWKGRIWNLITQVIENYGQVTSADHDIEEWDRKIAQVRNMYLAEINFNFETTFMISVAITAMQQLTEFLRGIPVEVAVNSETYLQTLADVIIMLSPMSPSFSRELWEGFRSKVTSCSDFDMTKTLDEQTWPELNKESTMLLVVKCNKQIIYETSVPYTKLNSLTKEEAMHYSTSHPVYREYLEGQKVKRVHLKIRPDYKAVLEYTIPSMESKVTKMLNRQRKQSVYDS